MSISRFRLLAALAFAFAAASCDSPSGPTPTGTPAHLDIVSGDLQSGVVGAELSSPLVVKVTDDQGKPVKGQVVNFRVTAGNGAVFAGAAQTNDAGQAQERWTLGTVARDTQRVEVRAVDPSTGAPLVFATFRAVGRPDAPASLAKVGGDAQTGAAGAALADSLAVKLADRYGNVVSGQAVGFAVTGGGGSVSPATRATDSSGIARAQWTLGTRLDSAQTLAATFGSLAPATFAATATVSGTFAKLSGDNQTGVVGRPLADSLAVRLTTPGGVPLCGATIQWSTTSDGASLVPATSPTDANGVAKASWLLGRHTGPQTASAGVVGTGQTVSFTATGTAGPAVYFTIGEGFDQTGKVGSTLPVPLLVRVHDLYGNPAVTETVQWTVTDGGGTVTPPTSLPDTAGNARTTWTLGPLVGMQKVEARTASLGPLVISATANFASTVVDSPSVGGFAGDTAHVRVHTSPATQPATITATVEGRTVSLLRSGSTWTGNLVLAGLARGAKEMTFTSTDPDGATHLTVVRFYFDAAPTVAISAPLPYEVVPLQVRVTASCTDDDPAGCASTAVFGYYFDDDSYHQLAAGGSHFDQTLTLDPILDGRPVLLQVVGTDTRGQRGSASVRIQVENAVTGWTRIAFTQGRVHDVSTDRVLYSDSTGGVESLKVLTRASGTSTTLWTGAAGHAVQIAALGPHGAIFEEGINGVDAVHEWRDGVLDPTAPASSSAQLQVSGTWAVYVTFNLPSRNLHRRDLETGADVTLGPVLGGTAGPNGDVVYDTPAYDIYRYRNGAATLIAAHTSDSTFNAPVTDGTSIVYLKRQGLASSGQIVLYDAGAEVLLATSTTLPQASTGYRIAGGWVAYIPTAAGGASQIWVRSPAGTARQVASGTSCGLLALDASGTTAYRCGGQSYVVRPNASPTYLARFWPRGGPVFLADGTLAFKVGGSAFQVPF
ncbi:MAG: hypothetical protein JWM27_4522 [Gemmatimonadetes bacterium]|nr:hypothetical protein [Gemmatimonadota bacterium]